MSILIDFGTGLLLALGFFLLGFATCALTVWRHRAFLREHIG